MPTGLQGYVVDRESPRRGFRHVLSKRDLRAFIDLIPDWDRLSQRLERIVLGSDNSYDGEYVFYHREQTSSIFLNAWQEDLWMEIASEYFDSHKEIFQRLGVSYDKTAKAVLCRFTEAQARAFMLLHVFMHELGHHHDRLQQKHRDGTRGEDYAERFANSRFNQMLSDYVRIFGDPSKQNGTDQRCY
ncbi:MAG: hypothetical protein ABI042_15315 [Verrucomicrobiota bacterium]